MKRTTLSNRSLSSRLSNGDLDVHAVVTRLGKRHLRKKRKTLEPPVEPGWVVGVNDSGRRVTIPYKSLYESHVCMIGPSGRGKSYLAYSLIAQAILHDHPVCVIDPDGSLYSMVEQFVMANQIPDERLVLIDARRSDWSPRLNPLEFTSGHGSGLGADIAASSLLQVGGQYSFDQMPQLQSCVNAISHSMSVANYPLSVLAWLLSVSPQGTQLRRQMTASGLNDFVRLFWDEVGAMQPREQRDLLRSTLNRVGGFGKDPRMNQMLTSRVGNVDWERVVRERQIVLCSGGQTGIDPIGQSDVSLLCGLVLNALSLVSYRMPIDSGSHLFIFADEFSTYLTGEVADGLERLRKRGTHYVLMMQSINQVRLVNNELWDAIANNAQIKLFFGGASREDTEQMAREVFTGHLDFDQVKYETRTRSFEPVLRWEEIVSHSEGHGKSSSKSESTSTTLGQAVTSSYGSSSSSSSGTTVVYSYDSGVLPLFPDTVSYANSSTESASAVTSTSDIHSETTTSASTQGTSESWGTTRTRVPVSDAVAFYQEPNRQFRSYQEVWEDCYAKLKLLPKRHLVVAIENLPPQIVETLPVEGRVFDTDEIRRYEDRIFAASPYHTTSQEARETFQQLLIEIGFKDDQPSPYCDSSDTYDDLADAFSSCPDDAVIRGAVFEVRRDNGRQAEIVPDDMVVDGTVDVRSPNGLPEPQRRLSDDSEPDHFDCQTPSVFDESDEN